MAEKKLTNARVKTALRDCGATLRLAANTLGCTPAALERFVESRPKIKAHADGIVADIVAVAEGHVIEAVRDGDLPTVRWFLEQVRQEQVKE